VPLIDGLSGRAAACSWSGGKDSLLALRRSLDEGVDARVLVSMLDEGGTWSRSHGLHVDVLGAQARALGIPLITRATTWDDYTRAFEDALTEAAELGCSCCVFGDIDIDEHREWCREAAGSAGLSAVHPLWLESRYALIDELLRDGYRAKIVVVRLSSLDGSFLGRELDQPLVEELAAAGVDLCGENGEFHTVVTDGPLFSEPITLRAVAEVRVAGCSGLRLLLDGASAHS
jgi:uncharacterized protein (TIGR00290 family)